MINTLDMYPKSSCYCYNCEDRDYEVLQPGFPTNLSVTNCDIPNYFECHDRYPFKDSIEPDSYKKGYTILNPQLAQQTYASDFKQVDCKANKNCETVYISTDPRLIDVPRAMAVPLDKPPFDDSVKLDEVYNPNLTNYGKNYRTYSDINAGQITYYIDRSIEDALFEPVFSSSAQVIGTLYQDPMGAMKPQYDRFPLKNSNHLNTLRDNYDGCLSWIEDSQEQRQDLMSRQMRKNNEQRWDPRWT